MTDYASTTRTTFTVAPGRTIEGADETIYMPGDEIALGAADAERFLALGFILDQDGSRVLLTNGPATDVEDGVQITRDGQ